MTNKEPTADLVLRNAAADDVPLILQFIRDLAEYEKLLHECVATEQSLRDELFGPHPSAEVLLAYVGDRPAGFALFFHSFSTFVGRKGLYLEDLFVRPAYRGKGIGVALLRRLASLAVERGCGRFEWAVLDWNESAIGFYEALGARPLKDWIVYRLAGPSLAAVAAQDTGTDR